MSYFFNLVLIRPLFNLLVLLYNTAALHDIGLAIILITVLMRLALLPLSNKAIKSQKALQDLQPQIKAIQEKYKDNKEEQTKQVMDFYKKNEINPFSGCLPILVQLPILIALYRVFLKGFDPSALSWLYSFVKNPGAIDSVFLSFLNLAHPNKIMALLAGALQFWQAKMIMPKNAPAGAPKSSDEYMAQAISKQTLYFLPVLTVLISWRLPAGLTLYWAVTTLFTVFQQYAMLSSKKK